MSINQIRKEMGFSQQELAGYLGLSRTQVADFESGQRDLPHKATGKWTRMKHCLDSAEELDANAAAIQQAHQQQQVAPFMAKMASRCQRNVYVLQQQLQAMETEYAECVGTLALIAQLCKLPPSSRGNEIWINQVEARMQKNCWACGPGKQAVVSLKLQAMVWMQEQLASQYGG